MKPPEHNYDDALGVISARRRKRRAMRRRRQNRSLIASGFVALVILGVALVVTAGAGAGLAAYSVVDGLDLKNMKRHEPGVNTTIYAANGVKLYTVPSVENRVPVSRTNISPWLKKATVDIEDRRFYQHGGVDFEGIFRAALDDINAGHVVQGASTIEQQVVRNLYLNNDVSATRKLKEAWLAMQMSDRWSKDKILSTYLNVVPYGGVTYGCESAAEVYFSVHCKQLGITQAAMLAGIPQSPTQYNPNINRHATLVRRNQVLTAMFNNGDLTYTQYTRAVHTGLKLHPYTGGADPKQPFFVQFVESILKDRYGKKMLHQGGLQVQTTIDPRLQRAAHDAEMSIPHGGKYPDTALVSIDPRTGAIVAFNSSADWHKSKFDLPGSASRQAGSSFKPFTLMAAMMYKHIDPETTQYSAQSPFYYPTGCTSGVGNCWEVNNADIAESGNFDLHTAMDGSINAVFGRLSADIGAADSVRMAHRLGIPESTKLPEVLSIVLGTGGVSPLSMASAYSSFAGGGIHHDPIAITGVKSYNKKIDDSTPAAKNPGTRVIPAWAADEMNSILVDNITCARGLCTGGAGALPDGRPAAGKTGTVEEHQDAWFCGYTPVLVTCVWMGFPQGDSDAYSMKNVLGTQETFGGGYPTEVWQRFMSSAFALEPGHYPAVDFGDAQPPSTWYQPFTSQFPLSAPPVAPTKPKDNGKKNGGGNGTGTGTGTGKTAGNGGGNGGGGGGTTSPPTT